MIGTRAGFPWSHDRYRFNKNFWKISHSENTVRMVVFLNSFGALELCLKLLWSFRSVTKFADRFYKLQTAQSESERQSFWQYFSKILVKPVAIMGSWKSNTCPNHYKCSWVWTRKDGTAWEGRNVFDAPTHRTVQQVLWCYAWVGFLFSTRPVLCFLTVKTDKDFMNQSVNWKHRDRWTISFLITIFFEDRKIDQPTNFYFGWTR